MCVCIYLSSIEERHRQRDRQREENIFVIVGLIELGKCGRGKENDMYLNTLHMHMKMYEEGIMKCTENLKTGSRK
jgi:hypothetical protein